MEHPSHLSRKVIFKYISIIFPKTPSGIMEELEKVRPKNIKVKDVYEILYILNIPGQKTYHIKDKEFLIISKDDIEYSQSVGATKTSIWKHIFSIIKQLNPYKANKNIKQCYIYRYSKHAI